MSRRSLEFVLIGAALLGGIVLGACHVTRPNADHCFYAEGDHSCAELDPSRPYCAGPGCGEVVPGCVAELPPDDCYSPCGHAALLDDDASCIDPTGAGDTTETSGETGDETSSSGALDMSVDECQDHADCPELEPYCSFGTCTSYDATPDPAAACFALTDGESTICLDGQCVICTEQDASACTDTTPRFCTAPCEPRTRPCACATACCARR